MSFNNHGAYGDLKRLGAFTPQPTKAVLDSAAAAAKAEAEAKREAYLDAAGEHAANDIRSEAVASLFAWAATTPEDLDAGESMADRLLAYAVGIADDNKDGELTDEESEVVNIALNAMADYLVELGATEEDAVALIQDGDSDAAGRLAELVGASGEDGVDAFVFDAESSESVMDSILDGVASGDPQLDAVYKKKLVIRKGKKVRINKRVSGHVRLTAGQKVAIRKAGRKAHSASARIRRMRSMKVRRKTIG